MHPPANPRDGTLCNLLNRMLLLYRHNRRFCKRFFLFSTKNLFRFLTSYCQKIITDHVHGITLNASPLLRQQTVRSGAERVIQLSAAPWTAASDTVTGAPRAASIRLTWWNFPSRSVTMHIALRPGKDLQPGGQALQPVAQRHARGKGGRSPPLIQLAVHAGDSRRLSTWYLGLSSRWASSPSSVSSSKPSVSLSSRPTGDKSTAAQLRRQQVQHRGLPVCPRWRSGRRRAYAA